MNKIKQFLAEEDGATAVEYGIFVAAIAAIIVATVFSIGAKTQAGFAAVDAALPAGTP